MSDSARSGPSDRSLLHRIQSGSEGAAGELHRRYADRLLALTRARAGADWRSREDAEDVVQSVFGSFFRGASGGMYRAPDGDELWGLILTIALNKIRAKGQFHRAAKRDVRRTVGEGDRDDRAFDPPEDPTAAHRLLQVVADELIQGLPDSHREIVRLRAEGYEIAEIAGSTGRSKRSVERVLQELRARFAPETGPLSSHDSRDRPTPE